MRLTILLLATLTSACGSSTPATRPDPVPLSHHEHREPEVVALVPDAGAPSTVDDGGSAPPSDVASAAEPASPAVAEQMAYERARPVFDRFCASCHVRREGRPITGALRHFDMTSYPFGGHHASNLTATIRHVLGADGGRATMPRNDPGSVRGDDLALVLSWAEAFDRAHVGEPHSHHHKAITR